ncbi:gliding motility-associated C-terminal domain-containing protein [Ginsengibacter hankyongi]|uniref:Gliding motility-associated C-terminal domain-containing protein n=1 Tax=Ginsengibacter hankyongi TaxID=2607284 RepID=A0A5J5IDU3_9BACT|nr:gliding motility-associated C-terminal domain-containing protein [Ginsengibacter hankyongi]KAA9038082.1 gliding motility-associated C-terminal domain-containing protein [Ginsengibacter hankyongi]
MYKLLMKETVMRPPLKMLVAFLLFTFLYCFESNAQLCQGSLGDPVVNITFGAGSNSGPPLGSTNYTYVPKDCPNDGFYTIANSTRNCFNGTWHTLTEDHTPGDVNGYMMVVNASYTPGDFFVKTVDGLCPNTTYEFASWIYNVLQPYACDGHGIKPNITFSIETTSGTVLQTYSTGDLPMVANWTQYGFFFSTTSGTNSVVLRMTNNAPGGCGNDLLLDDITFRACGPLVTANINGVADSVDVCTGDNSVFTLHANVSAGYSDPVYQWELSINNGASWANISGANDTVYTRPATPNVATYLYRLAVSQRENINVSTCSILSNIVKVGVNEYPVTDASNRGSCIGDTLFLNANGGSFFSWAGPMNFLSTEQSPFIAPTAAENSGIYFVKVTSSKGCTTADSTKVDLISKPSVYAGDDAEICEGATVQLNAAGSDNITSYSWAPPQGISDPNIPNPVALPKETTLYILTVANNECKVYDSLLITVDKNPSANAGPDRVIIKGQSVTLSGTADGTDVNYFWAPNTNITGTETLVPVVSPPASQVYVLNVISNKGCGTATDSVLVKVYQQLYIPNAFTPNGDGVNDNWFIETLQAYPGAQVKVYNRYGQIVFDNHRKNIWWDGKFKGVQLTSGAYVYIIDLKNNTPVIKGVVYVLL